MRCWVFLMSLLKKKTLNMSAVTNSVGADCVWPSWSSFIQSSMCHLSSFDLHNESTFCMVIMKVHFAW